MKNHKKPFSFLFCGVTYIFLTGFFWGAPEREAEQFVNETQTHLRATHRVHLPPKPVLKKITPFVYSAGDKDPFALKAFVLEIQTEGEKEKDTFCRSANCGDGAPTAHAPYFLEGFDLDKLYMVGTIRNDKGHRVVLIKTPDSGVVKTKVGEYIGRSNGLILSISPDHIVIQEKQRVPKGWKNRMRTLELFN